MKKLLVALLPLMLLACSKDDNSNDATSRKFANYVGRYLVCDSSKVSGATRAQVVGKGKGFDLNFGPYANLTIYSTPEQNLKYQLVSPDKIYYFQETFNENSYYLIKAMESDKIALQTSENNQQVTRYYTAE